MAALPFILSSFLYREPYLLQELHSVPQALHLLRHVLRQAEASAWIGETVTRVRRRSLRKKLGGRVKGDQSRGSPQPGSLQVLYLGGKPLLARPPGPHQSRGKIHGRGRVPKVHTGESSERLRAHEEGWRGWGGVGGGGR